MKLDHTLISNYSDLILTAPPEWSLFSHYKSDSFEKVVNSPKVMSGYFIYKYPKLDVTYLRKGFNITEENLSLRVFFFFNQTLYS